MRSTYSFTADLFLPYDSIIHLFPRIVNIPQNNYEGYMMMCEIVKNIQKNICKNKFR